MATETKKEVRYLLEFKSDRLEKEFMGDFEFKGVKNDKYTKTGDRYREISVNGEMKYQYILADQAMIVDKKKLTISQTLWQNISGNTNVFSQMYKNVKGVYAEKVTVNGGGFYRFGLQKLRMMSLLNQLSIMNSQ